MQERVQCPGGTQENDWSSETKRSTVVGWAGEMGRGQALWSLGRLLRALVSSSAQ